MSMWKLIAIGALIGTALAATAYYRSIAMPKAPPGYVTFDKGTVFYNNEIGLIDPHFTVGARGGKSDEEIIRWRRGDRLMQQP